MHIKGVKSRVFVRIYEKNAKMYEYLKNWKTQMLFFLGISYFKEYILKVCNKVDSFRLINDNQND